MTGFIVTSTEEPDCCSRRRAQLKRSQSIEAPVRSQMTRLLIVLSILVAGLWIPAHAESSPDPYANETLEAIANSVELTLPDSEVYHEDVIYAAASAALDGGLHDDDSASGLEPSDCNDGDELEGSEESDKETEWQLNALKLRLLEDDS